jgi:hypothetical protein
MPLTFLLDEHFRGLLGRAIQSHNRQSGYPIDALRVGDPPDLPLGSLDPDILLWTEREGRILLSHDKKTMVPDFVQHLHAGRHSPGLLIVHKRYTLPALLGTLEAIAHFGDPADYLDQIDYIP